jgi:hypothetical protein
MPASRWWEFEDARVNFGDLDAGPADLARLLVAEFAAAYSDDWFGFPLRVRVGTLNEIVALEVIDNFGARPSIPSTAFSDTQRVGAARAWRLFELTGDEVSPAHPSPWLFVPPTVAGDAGGPILEHVALARDENANLAWAIERVVEGPLGRAVNRAEAWHALQGSSAPRPGGTTPNPASDPLEYPEQYWRYRLETSAPPWWIPLVPERLSERTPEVRLRRARMRAWDLLREGGTAESQVGPQGVLLDPRRPCWFFEEEVPRAGARVERRWQSARWHDGSFHVWLQRRKLTGRGERSSGLRWDLLEPGAAAGRKPGPG